MIVTIQNKPKWLFSQLGQLVIAVGLLSLVFNYAYRYTVDRHINTPTFHVATIVLGLIAFLIIRRDYVFALHLQRVRDTQTQRNIRNYSWTGFSPDDFQKVSQMYGYRGETDFKQKDFGKR
ncbi:hypothetical protein LMG3458_04025 [Achromobacter deleyi]|uniref:Uncharacterized protein n=2 Tax=Achromobacter deleyi TaxID=1353891 RepID=A0A6S7AJ05_9BURK|nr:hypothetical protein LMG3458_04025 [Achromobacter deleyi]CAB3894345.1 hypothetical protein LMG3482_03967 [Achromobacter deleyi]CAB3917217.1 hypothetical protein LMG3481_05110 [Achromobacter deleyi]